MENLRFKTLDGNSIILESSIVEGLAASLRGRILVDHDAEYDKSRAVWNGMIDRNPALIIKCSGASDVIKAVKFAGKYSLLLSVKCGGHNFGGLSVCDGGLMIDLSSMNSIRVDPVGKTARAEGGVLLSEFDKETQSFGLATTTGIVSHTGIAGLTLGGGQGWLMNKYGLTCDNLVSVDIVTANGELLTANKDKNTDIFWAVRGGGGNFGIVTSFEYRLYPVGPIILGGLIIYPIGLAKKVLKFYKEFSMNTPDELSMIASMLCLPDGTPVIALVAGWMGDLKDGNIILQQLREFETPTADMIGEMPYVQLQAIFDAAVPYGMPRYGKMGYLPQLTDEFMDTAIAYWNKRTSPYSLIIFNVMKGMFSQKSPDETPFFNRSNQWHYDIVSQWVDRQDEEKHIDWARALWNDTAALTRGSSINFLATDEGNDRVKQSFGTNYERLSEIKAKYDPNNLFRLNANILPAMIDA